MNRWFIGHIVTNNAMMPRPLNWYQVDIGIVSEALRVYTQCHRALRERFPDRLRIKSQHAIIARTLLSKSHLRADTINYTAIGCRCSTFISYSTVATFVTDDL